VREHLAVTPSIAIQDMTVGYGGPPVLTELAWGAHARATGRKEGQTLFYEPCAGRNSRRRVADILLVDDETFLHEIYSDFLQLHGHKVVGIAYNGEEAVALYRSLPKKPEIVIMDQRMPIKSGVDATKEILALEVEEEHQGRLGHLPRLLLIQTWGAISLGDWTTAMSAADEAERLAAETAEPFWTAGAQAMRVVPAGFSRIVPSPSSSAPK